MNNKNQLCETGIYILHIYKSKLWFQIDFPAAMRKKVNLKQKKFQDNTLKEKR